jgi:hypothetical protein
MSLASSLSPFTPPPPRLAMAQLSQITLCVHGNIVILCCSLNKVDCRTWQELHRWRRVLQPLTALSAMHRGRCTPPFNGTAGQHQHDSTGLPFTAVTRRSLTYHFTTINGHPVHHLKAACVKFPSNPPLQPSEGTASRRHKLQPVLQSATATDCHLYCSQPPPQITTCTAVSLTA